MSRFLRPLLLLALIAIAVGWTTYATAQPFRSPGREICTIGPYVNLSWERLRSAFAIDASGNIVGGTSCGVFERGSATSLRAGVRVDRPLAGAWRIGCDLEVSRRSGDLRFPCVDPAQIRLPDGSLEQALTEHVATITSVTATLLPCLAYRPTALPVQVFAGPCASYVLSGTYDVREELVSPRIGEFLTGGQVREYGGGSLRPLSRPMNIGLHTGASVRLQAGRNLSVEPSVRADLWLGDDVRELGLGGSSIGASIALLYRLDKPLRPVIVSSEGHGAGNALVSLRGGGLGSDGRVSDTLRGVRVRRLSTQLHPLLSYVFFDRDNTSIAPRYHRRTAESARSFTEQSLRGESTLDMYYSLLDIVGARMVRSPGSRVAIVGCGAEGSTDSAGRALGYDRAASVRDYLHAVWGIDTLRLAIESRHLPLAPSSEETEDGAAENRRVEIRSDDVSITAPLVFVDTLRSIEWQPLVVDMALESPSEVPSWSVVSGDVQIGSGENARTVAERFIVDAPTTVLTDAREVTLALRYETDDGTVGMATERVPIAIADEQSMPRLGTGSYSLILFDFRSAILRPEHVWTLSLINTGTDPNALARVEGYTDRMGSDDLNARLSAERAAAVAACLTMKVDEVVGKGESTVIYDNNVPEGRFYSRSVTIVTRLPE